MEKTNIHFRGNGAAVTIPGLIVSAPQFTTVQRADGRNIPAKLVEVISLRDSNPDGANAGIKYLRKSIENAAFMTDRFDTVVGLDVDADGVVMSYRDLEVQRAKDIDAIQARNTATVEVEL